MVRLTRTVWIQLAILTVVTVVAGSIMAFGFVKIPALLGIGRYTVTVDMPAAGGLYPTSVVTYRGTEVGRVRSVDITETGVRAVLTMNSNTPVPGDVSANVHSRSAVGEQFLELTPKPAADTAQPLRNGDVIPAGRVQIPADIAKLLDATNRALKAIPQENLRTVVEEANKAVSGLGPELSRIVDGSTALGIDAGKANDSITSLIDQSPPVLDSQVRTADSIATWAARMAAITGQLKATDTAFADLLGKGGPALEEGKALFDRISPTLPVLLANMVSLGDIALAYHASIEQLLVLFPQGTAVMSAIAAPNAGTKQAYRGIYLDFNLNLNLPPPCNTGFLPVQQQR
ncbi:MAG: MlaD family protein, partial [Mycobacteriaceae bacterium]